MIILDRKDNFNSSWEDVICSTNQIGKLIKQGENPYKRNISHYYQTRINHFFFSFTYSMRLQIHQKSKSLTFLLKIILKNVNTNQVHEPLCHYMT